ncbi:hypothetical protein NC796_07540 [Aliifodinibius sp. S!AR15-10]|uniref:hypothetical protein n=1 Tax=Aliifodinibius sp. S!AR15-10 TaxID=2950437 RepID=UPI002854E99B|nr:hypothetical protein [Aliifodinibius sp. S!AR15-10]MDR8390985.1 hypothetical protein [Aliifodinibius sp. S!AR15-10]
MENGKYQYKPHTPKILNDNGAEFWELYCRYLMARDVLEPAFLPIIESLCVLEQERVEIQEKLNNKSGDSELHKTLNTVLTKIRQLKDDLGIYPRKNEFKNPYKSDDKEDEKENEKQTKLRSLRAKNF